jgi:predicted nucleotidyltransferase
MALAQSGRGAVQRELSRLLDSGLITTHMVATQKHYQANPASPLFHELRRIVQKTVGLNEPIGLALHPLADKIELAFIYGSIAKGSDYSASDIDIMVVSDDIRLEDLFCILVPAEEVLDRRISPILLSVREFQKRRESDGSFVARILSGPTISVIGTIGGN